MAIATSTVGRRLPAAAVVALSSLAALVAVPTPASATPDGQVNASMSIGDDVLALGQTTRLTYTLQHVSGSTTATNLNFETSYWPADVKVAAAPHLANTCGGTASAAAGGTSLSLATGGPLTPGSTCSVAVDVTAWRMPLYLSSADETFEIDGNYTAGYQDYYGATQHVWVDISPTPTLTLRTAAANHWATVGDSAPLVLRIANNNPEPLTGMATSFDLPPQLVIATPSHASSSCGGTFTAPAGGTSVTLSGGTVPAQGDPGSACTAAVDVSAVAPGAGYVPAGLSTTQTGAGYSTEAKFTIFPAGPRLLYVSDAAHVGSISQANTTGAVLSALVGSASVNDVEDARGLALDLAAARTVWTALEGVPANPEWQPFTTALDGRTTGPIDTHGAAAKTAVAVDSAHDRLYLGDRTISWTHLDGSGGAALDTSDATPGAVAMMAVDPTVGKVFYTHSDNNVISWAKLDGSASGDLDTGTAPRSTPTGIAVDDVNGRVYWANAGLNNIAYAALDGSSSGVLDTTGATVNGPYGVAIDTVKGRVYWGNSVAGGVYFASVGGGSGGRLLRPADVDQPWGIALAYGPRAKSPPTITGGSTVGTKLTCSRGTWAADLPAAQLYRVPSRYAYSWSRNGTKIAGATRATYTTKQTGTYKCTVTAGNLAGQTAQTSAGHQI